MNVYRRAKSVVREALKERRRRHLLEDRARRRAAGPQFADLLEARGDWLYRNLPEPAAEYIYDLHPKDKQKRLATRLGLSVAEEYLSHVPLVEALAFIESTHLEYFVLKPNSGKSAAGVFCLARERGGYRDVRSGKRRTITQLKELADETYGKLGRADDWLVEELLLAPGGSTHTTGDFKFYCFGSRAEVILQKGYVGTGKSHKPAIRFYDRDGGPVDTGVRPDLISDLLELPATIDAMRTEAERVSGLITTPFMRVDLYDTHRGVVLGELTPGPGGMRALNDEWDKRLTRRWHESAGVLERGLLTGEIQPLMPDEAASAGVG